MSAMWILYFAEVSGGLKVFFAIAAAIIGIVGFIAAVAAFETGDRDVADRALKVGAPLVSFLIVASVLIPSKQTVYMMAAAKVSQDIIESPDAKLIGDKLLKIINKELDELVKGEE